MGICRLPTIHPTAIVDPAAQLADDVQIGPGCIIEGPAVIGAATRLIAQVYIKGAVHLGERNVLYPNVCVGFEPQHRAHLDPRNKVAVRIGDDNLLREGVTIHDNTGNQVTTLGSRNFLMSNSHIGHDSVIGDDCTLANGALIAGHVQVADRVTIGGNGGVHQFCRVGRLAMIGGIVALTQDVPPFCVCHTHRTVGALNIVGLRRAGLRAHIAPLKRAFDIIYRESRSNPSAVAAIKDQLAGDPLCIEMAQFIEQTTRGIAPYYRSQDA